ncbi:unnamed protein product [Cylindrotheca closterium]|uniref:Uncharacterized protein n=1 Tax=Cylindrotheca closterium TaxID=2856 RepID=A0AAD2JLE0_9STRA|nr:unnamed protein product [Cylindrotheca closterium]
MMMMAFFNSSALPVWMMLLLCSRFTTVQADTVQLAECPKEPNVVGVYINNGSNCVRERNEMAREIVDATCKTGWELITTPTQSQSYCQPSLNANANTNDNDSDTNDDKSSNNNNNSNKDPASVPTCPVDYQRYGTQCHSPCPRGYNSKRGKCIQLKDSMPQHSMTCPNDNNNSNNNKNLHRIGAYCCESDQCGDLIQARHEIRIQKMQQQKAGSQSQNAILPPSTTSLTECNLPSVPGRFYYNPMTGRCDRSRISEPRVWKKLPRDNKNRYIGTCDEERETKVLGGCQPKCPPYYKSQKGMCHLPPCSIPFGRGMNDYDEKENDKMKSNNGIVLCPEGKYYLASQSF